MKYLRLNFTCLFSFFQKASSVFANNNLLKRFLYQLRINVLPSIFMLVFSCIIALYFSELIERSKLRSNDFKPAQASHSRAMNTEAHAFAKK